MIMVLGLLAALGFAYMTFFNNPEEGDLEFGFEGEEGVIETDAGTEIIMLLESLKQIRLDDSLFTSPAFVALRDYNREIDRINIGRNNPFAEIGRDTLFVPSSSASNRPASSVAPGIPPGATSSAPVGGAVPVTTTGAQR